MRCTILAALWNAPVSIYANTITEASRAIASQDYAYAEELLDALIAAENPAAMVLLAEMHRVGAGVDINERRARKLYRRAAKLGDAEANYQMGNYYLTGDGVSQDLATAVKHFRRAAVKGHALGARTLIEVLRERGVASVVEFSHERLNAIDFSDDEQRAIAIARAQGMRILKPDKQAHVEVNVSLSEEESVTEDRSDSSVEDELIDDIEEGIGQSPVEIETSTMPEVETPSVTDAYGAKERAAELFQRAERYAHGDGLGKDEAMAITLYRQAAEAGHSRAFERLREIYRDSGLEVPDTLFVRPPKSVDR